MSDKQGQAGATQRKGLRPSQGGGGANNGVMTGGWTGQAKHLNKFETERGSESSNKAVAFCPHESLAPVQLTALIATRDV